MRVAHLAIAGIAAMLVWSAPAQAGILELGYDEVSRTRDCSSKPCRGNDLEYRKRFVRDRYLRYHVHRTPPQYRTVRERIMVVPPRVAVYGEPARYEFVDGKWLLVATGKRVRVYQEPVYEEVEREVLVKPAKHRVHREKPHSAYWAETIVVREEPCTILGLIPC